ncbi:unnamed protein product [Phytophthora lilii]|uniref:Unnamed protein product n=1 Tax=Phytophthora lilii TaxID=2077276 RepID=A0A9W6WPY4_9STRA|nr:unnamed protein product [Phytophthora lilii]
MRFYVFALAAFLALLSSSVTLAIPSESSLTAASSVASPGALPDKLLRRSSANSAMSASDTIEDKERIFSSTFTSKATLPAKVRYWASAEKSDDFVKKA